MHPITERFGVEIGLDTRGPFEVSDIALVEAALARFAVLVFPDQNLSEARQKAFAAHFGKFEGDAAAPRISFVFARTIPPVGGLTEFIDLRVAGAQATPRQVGYAHRWRVGDLVMWDERCALRQDRPFDDTRFARDLCCVTVS